MSSLRRALSSVGLLAAANGLNAVLAFVVSILAARVLERSEFGRIAVLMAASVTFAIGLDLGVNQILVRRVAVRPASRLLPDVLRLRVYFAVAATAVTVVMVLADALQGWVEPLRSSAWALLTSSAAWQLVFSTEQAHVQGRQRFGALALQTVAVGAVRLAFVALAAAAGAGYAGVLLAYAVPPALVGATTVARFWRALVRPARFRLIRALVPVIGLAGITVALTALLPRVGLWAVASMGGEAQAGSYAVAFQAASLVLTLGAAVTLLIVPHVARLDREGRVHAFLVTYLRAAVPIGVVMAGGAVIFSRLVPRVFGPRYAGTEMVTFWLMLSFLVSLLNGPFYALHQSRFRYARLVVVHAVQFAILLIACVVLVPRHGAAGAAMADLCARGVVVVWLIALALAETRFDRGRSMGRAIASRNTITESSDVV